MIVEAAGIWVTSVPTFTAWCRAVPKGLARRWSIPPLLGQYGLCHRRGEPPASGLPILRNGYAVALVSRRGRDFVRVAAAIHLVAGSAHLRSRGGLWR